MNRAALTITLLALLTTALSAPPMDPPGKPNESVDDILERLKGEAMTLAQRYEYFDHYSPVVRRAASFSLMREGKKAMPLIRKALGSKDKRVLRAGCDALCGPFGVGMVGRGRRELQAVMTPEIVGTVAPRLAELLDHPDVYVRDGALLALSNAGKAAAGYLPKIAKLRDDEHWWIRSAASKVLKRVGQPEADKYATATTERFVREPYVYAKRRYQEAVLELVQSGRKQEEIFAILTKALSEQKRDYFRYLILEAIYKLGPKGAAALPAVEKLLKVEQANLAKATDTKTRSEIEWIIKYIEKVIVRIKPETPKAGSRRS